MRGESAHRSGRERAASSVARRRPSVTEGGGVVRLVSCLWAQDVMDSLHGYNESVRAKSGRDGEGITIQLWRRKGMLLILDLINRACCFAPCSPSPPVTTS